MFAKPPRIRRTQRSARSAARFAECARRADQPTEGVQPAWGGGWVGFAVVVWRAHACESCARCSMSRATEFGGTCHPNSTRLSNVLSYMLQAGPDAVGLCVREEGTEHWQIYKDAVTEPMNRNARVGVFVDEMHAEWMRSNKQCRHNTNKKQKTIYVGKAVALAMFPQLGPPLNRAPGPTTAVTTQPAIAVFVTKHRANELCDMWYSTYSSLLQRIYITFEYHQTQTGFWWI